MIYADTIRDINESTEGKLLIAAIAILTSIDKEDIREGKWGGMVHPDDAFQRIVDLANRIYYEEEWKIEQVKIKRNDKLNSIVSKVQDN